MSPTGILATPMATACRTVGRAFGDTRAVLDRSPDPPIWSAKPGLVEVTARAGAMEGAQASRGLTQPPSFEAWTTPCTYREARPSPDRSLWS